MKRIIQVVVVVLSLSGSGCGSDPVVDTLPDVTVADATIADASTSEDASTSQDVSTPQDASASDVLGAEDAPSTSLTSFFGPDNFVRIADGEGGFAEGELDAGDRFARDHDQAGDINGDGITDLIVGARSDDDGGTDRGAAYVLFMNADGSVDSHQKISDLEGGFDDPLVDGNFFGYGVAGIGDYDGDDIPDVAVSALGRANTAIYILHLNRDGTVKSMVKNVDIVGQGLTAVDLNQDGKLDLVAADPNSGSGVIRLVFFDEDSAAIDEETVTIGANMGGFGEGLSDGDSFGGRESALLGDIDGDGTLELAVGAFQSEGGTGAIWILSLDGTTFEVVDKLKVGPGFAGFDETIPNDMNNNGTTGGHFGHAMVGVGDINGDGVPDLMTGANQYESGVAYILYLNPDKSVRTFTRIDEVEGGFGLSLGVADRFSRSMALVNRTAESFTVNMGGGVSVGGSGAIYSLTFQACSIDQQGGNAFWSGGETLFTNWNHGTQTVTGPMSYEQCVLTAFELGATHITAKESDGRCIIKDASAVLSDSDEGSQAYIRRCP